MNQDTSDSILVERVSFAVDFTPPLPPRVPMTTTAGKILRVLFGVGAGIASLRARTARTSVDRIAS